MFFGELHAERSQKGPARDVRRPASLEPERWLRLGQYRGNRAGTGVTDITSDSAALLAGVGSGSRDLSGCSVTLPKAGAGLLQTMRLRRGITLVDTGISGIVNGPDSLSGFMDGQASLSGKVLIFASQFTNLGRIES